MKEHAKTQNYAALGETPVFPGQPPIRRRFGCGPAAPDNPWRFADGKKYASTAAYSVPLAFSGRLLRRFCMPGISPFSPIVETMPNPLNP
jgi:hypothetical protein